MSYYDDDPRNTWQRINERLLCAEAYLDSNLPKIIVLLRKKRFVRIPWDPDFDSRAWHRKNLEWNFVRWLASLARAREHARMDDDQRAAHDRLLTRLETVVPELQRLGVKFPAVVLAQIEALNRRITKSEELRKPEPRRERSAPHDVADGPREDKAE